MKGLILAAGQGTRLRPLTERCPKPMLPVGGRPLLAHTIGWLRDEGITEIAINLHYRPEAVTDFFSNGRSLGVKLTYSYEDLPLGTAGAVWKLKEFLGQRFVVVYGDLLTRMDLSSMIAFHREKCAMVTIALYRVPNPTECGLVEVDGEDRIQRFVEKPGPEEVFTDWANAGVYVAEEGIIDYIPPGTFYDFGRDLFPKVLQAGELLYGYRTSEYILDIGTMEKYHWAQEDWAVGRVV